MMDRRTLLRATAAVLASAAAPHAYARGGSVQLVVVVGGTNGLTNIDVTDLRRLFSGDSVRDDRGNKLIPLNHPALSPDRVGFDRAVLGLTPEQVAKFWVDRRIRGQSAPPRSVDSLNLLLEVVKRLPGAIGYLRPIYVGADVRTLTISGKAPGSPGYPLYYTD